MAKDKIKIHKLVREWEKARPYELDSLVVRTAAYLTAIHQVPSHVVDSLDELAKDSPRSIATNVSVVVGFLRGLSQLERIGLSEPAPNRGPEKLMLREP